MGKLQKVDIAAEVKTTLTPLRLPLTGYVLLDATEIFLKLCGGEYFDLGEAYEQQLNDAQYQ